MKLLQKAEAFFNKIFDFIYKKRCYFCGKSQECVKMCSKCYGELVFADNKPDRELDGITVYCAGCYEKYLQKMIRGIKYHHQKDLGFYMAKFMWEYFSNLGLEKDYQVVPVPLHKSRKTMRGYNHMEIVADEFCSLSGYTPNYGLIKRIKNTKPQYKLSYHDKMKNVENAFKVDISKNLNKPILLIDDICTSGATLLSMIKELKSSGISDIVCLTASSPKSS